MLQGDPRHLASNLTMKVTTWKANFPLNAVVWHQESFEITSRSYSNFGPQGDPRCLTSKLTLKVTTYNTNFNWNAVVCHQKATSHISSKVISNDCWCQTTAPLWKSAFQNVTFKVKFEVKRRGSPWSIQLPSDRLESDLKRFLMTNCSVLWEISIPSRDL